MLESRPLGATGLVVSEIGVRLAGSPGDVAALARRAAREGCRLFVVDDPALIPAVRLPGAVVASTGGNAELLLGVPSAPRRVAVCDHAEELAAAVAGPGLAAVTIPFGFSDQTCSELLPKAGRAKLGILGIDSAEGRFHRTAEASVIRALVEGLQSLVGPRRTLLQASLQFSLANQHIESVIVRVRSEAELEEALAAPEAEPLTIPDLERLFETWAHRNDEDPGAGCGGRR